MDMKSTTFHPPNFDELMLEGLKDRPTSWPFDHNDATVNAFNHRANQCRLQPLLFIRLNETKSWSTWPHALRMLLQDAYRQEAAYQLLRRRRIEEVLAASRVLKHPPLLFKGASLAYSLYSQPELRPAVDVDLLIVPNELSRLSRLMKNLGYCQPYVYRGRLHSNAVVFEKRWGRATLQFDCHWAINNRPLFAGLVTYQELAARAIDLRDLKNGRGTNHVDALYIACLHRVGHNNTSDPLWLYDILHLVRQMTTDQREEFVQLVEEKHICQICATSLHLAADAFEDLATRQLATKIEAVATSHEATEIYLCPDRTNYEDVMTRFRSLPSVGMKLKYVQEVVLPRPNYLRRKYHPRHPGLAMPWLYVRNLFDVTTRYNQISTSHFQGKSSPVTRS